MSIKETNKIKYIHFILSILVILIHSINNNTRFERFFSSENGMGQFAVPLFFLISGFLFFKNANSMIDVKNKITKRVHTILLPYLLWNLIYYIIHLILKTGNEFDLAEIYLAMTNYTYNPAFWFMYQLILLIAISPILFLAFKNAKYLYLPIVVASLFILLGVDAPYINEDAIFYYYLGAIICKRYESNKFKFIDKKKAILFLSLSLISIAINKTIYYYVLPYNIKLVPIFTYTIVLARAIVSLFIFYLVDVFSSYSRVHSFMENTFVLYAVHYMIVKALNIFSKYFMYKFLPDNTYEIIEIIVFVLSPVICVIFNIYFVKFLKSKAPKALAILSGNRR